MDMPTQNLSLIKLNKLIVFVLFCFLLISCKNQKEEYKTDWSENVSFPDTYPIGVGYVEFFSGKGLNLNFPAVMAHDNWAGIGQVRSFEDTDLPDSIFVSYETLNDRNQTYLYEGGIKLPKKIIISLFKGEYGIIPQNINCGLAPGGRVCIFVDKIELIRFKIKEVKKISEKPILSNDSISEMEYFKYYPVDYTIWDMPDPRYELDFGFCNEDVKEYEFFGTTISKEGIRNTFDQYYLDKTIWGKPCNTEVDYKGNYYVQLNDDKNPIGIQLPVYLQLGWKEKGGKLYNTDVVLPKNFAQRFTKPYTNPKTGEKVNYNRLVFGVEKDGVHCIVWLDGPNKQEILMRFKGNLAKTISDSGIKTGGFSAEFEYY